MTDEELRIHLKRLGTPAALARLKYLDHIEAAARSREWKNGRRPGPQSLKFFRPRITEDEEDNDE